MADLNDLRKMMRENKETKTKVSLSAQKYGSSQLHESKPRTNNNSSEALNHYQLGRTYQYGLNGCSRDVRRAYSEYLTAAEMGNSDAMVKVARDYSNPNGILGYNISKAEMWAQRAIQNGNPNGYRGLYNVLREQNKSDDAYKILEAGASMNSRDCIEELSYLLWMGLCVKDDDKLEEAEQRAIRLLSSEDWDIDHPQANMILGCIFENREDFHKAVKYYEKTLIGFPEDHRTMTSLGRILVNEESVRDYSRGKYLLLTAANSGNTSAMDSLGVMYYLGNGVPQNYKVGKDWIEKAAQNNNTHAMVNMYHILADEENDKAMYWLNRAAKEGNEDAQNILNELENTPQVDFTRSSQIIDEFMEDWGNIINLEPYASVSQGFPNRLKRIQDVIDREGLSWEETDRLRSFMAAVSLLYFDYHLHNGNFTSLRQESYYAILDKVDELVGAMQTFTNEAAFIYYTANLYSANRFQDASPSAKLKEFWDNLQKIELVEGQTEWKVSFWKETAENIHKYMLSQVGSSYSNNSRYSEDYIKNRVISIVEDKLTLDYGEAKTYSRLVDDLGADSLDAVELIMEMEKEFNLTIPDEDAERIRTVGDIISYIKRHI